MKTKSLVVRTNVESVKGAALRVISFDLSATGAKALTSDSLRELPAPRKPLPEREQSRPLGTTPMTAE
jgi:hypothetical protein